MAIYKRKYWWRNRASQDRLPDIPCLAKLTDTSGDGFTRSQVAERLTGADQNGDVEALWMDELGDDEDGGSVFTVFICG